MKKNIFITGISTEVGKTLVASIVTEALQADYWKPVQSGELDYSDSDKVVLNVGFYYMANALGRLVGTLLSGVIFQYFGLSACLFVSTILVCLAVLLTKPLGKEQHLTDQVA